jgi:omega-amidase
MQIFKMALCQIRPERDKARNVQRAYAMAEEASANGARLIAFPEFFYYPYELAHVGGLSGDEDAILDGFRKLAKRKGIYLCCGSMVCNRGGKNYNTSHLIGPQGTDLLTYDKCHMFDAQIGDIQVKESAVFTAGDHVATAATELCTMGTLLCYDIRFPEMAREIARQGADLLLLPAAFNHITGAAHWHCFMRTRAIENQLFLAAISPARSTDPDAKYRAYGHSMVVSPWGDILAEAGEDETIIYADIDPEVLENVRKRLPLLQHRRNMLYTSFREDPK